MKILAIRGKNIASLEGIFELDFTREPFLSNGIFAISGSTGAGKSSLLDTMCLALFARTPRTEQARENTIRVKDVNEDLLTQGDPRFLLRRGTASGYAEVDFLAMNGYRYRAHWEVARARGKENGRLQNYAMTLYNLDKETEEQGRRTDIQSRIIELIGLTFEQFTRSVLLAQNDFATFLKAEQGEKASLLEKLTGTDIYSRISKLIFDKCAEARGGYELIRAQISAVALLTEDEETELKKQLSQTEEVCRVLETQIQEKKTKTDAWKQVVRQKEIKRDQQKTVLSGIELAGNQLKEASESLEKSRQELQKKEEDYQQIIPVLQEARRLDVQLDSLLKIKEEAADVVRKSVGENEAEEKKIIQLEESRKQHIETIRKLTDWFTKYREKEKTAGQLNELLIHLDASTALHHSLKDRKVRSAAFREKLRMTGEQKEKKSLNYDRKHKEYQQIQAELASIVKEAAAAPLQEALLEQQSLQIKRNDLLLEQARFVVEGSVKELREKLAENTPCPVCGSLIHPYAGEEAHKRINELTLSITELTLRLQETDKKVDLYQQRDHKIQLLSIKMTEEEKILIQLQAYIRELENTLKITGSLLEEEEKQLTGLENQLKRSLKEIDLLFDNDRWQVSWQENPEHFRHTLVDFAEEWSRKKESLSLQEEQKRALDAEIRFRTDNILKARLQLDENRIQFERKENEYQAVYKQRARILGCKPVDQIEKEHQEQIRLQADQIKSLQTAFTELTIQQEQKKGVAEQLDRDINQLSAEIEALDKELTTWLAEKQLTLEDHTLEDQYAASLKIRNEYQFLLRSQQEKKEQVKDLQQEADKKGALYTKWSKLNDLVGSQDGGKFRRMAQGYTLDILLSYANVQLRELTHRYRLERVPETLALQVIDRDMCDEIRTVHSLSGGESFLVSLALALGLSSLSSNRMKVESLFIDEGFGSLDADTLRMAMDALESLQTQGRKIGVISHVQEMTERIPVGIEVSRKGNGRSVIDIKQKAVISR